MTREALKLALEALEVFAASYSDGDEAITAIKAALAQPVQPATAQEPTDEALNTDALRYRWLVTNKVEHNGECWHFNHGPILWGPLGLGATIDQHIAAPQGEVK